MGWRYIWRDRRSRIRRTRGEPKTGLGIHCPPRMLELPDSILLDWLQRLLPLRWWDEKTYEQVYEQITG